ncbi:SMP-30/gluconolactonase/LRE family protein [Umezawaea beigongshangensis]|uniref:SMP-30/gluconolactonase/LRE family protein n=1 Tax=Umezawaea beigongshangensis TaxID=2780383 RepID=UPI0018F2554C|nr:superoxide dismutase [Umezawaea beigongshangensis]
MIRRSGIVAAVVVAFSLAVAAPASAGGPGGAFPAEFALPAGFQPEGIAISGTTAYFGSRVDGDVYAADLRTGRGRVLAEGPGTQSLGVKVDDRGRLFVAGGAGGDGRVIDTRTGRLLASHRFAADADTFVNDVVLTRDGAWFTDSRKAVLYRLSGRGEVSTLPLAGVAITPGATNLNGVVDGPDGRSLLVVQSNTGVLHRIDPRSGVATPVDLGGVALTHGDGLLREGRTLYVVQNRLNTVLGFRLDADGRRGELVATITDPRFDVPSTVASLGHRLYLPNARFTTPPTPTTEYSVVAVDEP